MLLYFRHLRKLPQLLESVDVDLRIAAGETLAVFYELGRQCREVIFFANIQMLSLILCMMFALNITNMYIIPSLMLLTIRNLFWF